MALYKGDTKLSGTGNGFDPLNSGSTGQILKKYGSGYRWENGTGTGDVVGPNGATDGNVAAFDGNTGTLIKDSGKSLNDYQEKLTAGTNIQISAGNVISATGGSEIEYKTQTEYTALLPGAASDGKHYFIYTPSIINVTGVTLDESSISLTTIGQTYQLTATVSPNDATDKSVTWNSSDNTVATVSPTGLVTCVTPGTATITVTTTDGGFTATCGVDAGWQPGANTVAYYKFDGTLDDETGNTTATIVKGVATYATDGDGQCFNANASNAMKTTIPPATFTSAFTISFWLKLNSVPSIFRIGGGIGSGGNHDYLNIQYESGNGGLQIYNNARTSWTWTPTTGTWCNIVIVGGGTANDLKAYLNGVEMTKTNNNYDYVISNAITIGICCNNGWGGNFVDILPGLMDSFIVESVAWTGTDVTKYYDQTKGDYGIS